MKVGDLVIYARSFYENHGFSKEKILEDVGVGIIQRVGNRYFDDNQVYVWWMKGYDCWEYPEELEVLSESR